VSLSDVLWGAAWDKVAGINPKTGKILIKFGYRTYRGVTTELNKLFRKWNDAD